MPLQWIPFGGDQVIVILSTIAVVGFWAACRVHDRVVARRADRQAQR
jgi:hypothetical protein